VASNAAHTPRTVRILMTGVCASALQSGAVYAQATEESELEELLRRLCLTTQKYVVLGHGEIRQ
jgi:hypothetical protein